MGQRSHYNHHRNTTIANLRIAGMTLQAIADIVGMHKASVSAILNHDPTARAILDQTQRALICLTPKVIRNYSRLMDDEDPSIRLKATEAVARNIGITPTHAHSQILQQIYVDQRPITADAGVGRQFARWYLTQPPAQPPGDGNTAPLPDADQPPYINRCGRSFEDATGTDVIDVEVSGTDEAGPGTDEAGPGIDDR